MASRSYNVLSLFSGIGGLCHGSIKMAGLQDKFIVKQFVEISKYAQKELLAIAPEIPIHSDICTFRANKNEFQILCGGVPCSGTSGAGKKLGLKDHRSGLWQEMFRIVKESRPAFLLIENVEGLLSRGIDQIVFDLDSEGYLGEWDIVSGEEVGLPHKRKRIFVIAYPNGLFNHQFASPWADQIGAEIEAIRLSEKRRVYKPGIFTVANGIPIGVAQNIPGNYDARRAYGLSCSPRQGAIAWKRIDYLTSLCEKTN